MGYRICKRLFDVVLALGLGLGLVPLLLLISLVILVTTGRPVFFLQARVGYRGRSFQVLKFRTLPTGPHDPTQPEAHATPVGQFLRRYALDELPQFWNILRGEMSMVGPRPILPKEAQNYNEHQRRRLDVLPGLTGWAQVNGRNALSWVQRIEHDLWYVDYCSFWLDVSILAKTPVALISGRGVYGLGNLDPGDAEFAARRRNTLDVKQET